MRRFSARWPAAIPGEPAAFEYLARKYGKLPLKQSLAPAIRLARDGFPLYARLQGAIRYKRQILLRSPDAARAFLTADGDVPEVGAIIKQADLANTLEAIADQGAKGFYQGRIAAELVAGVRADGGIWTLGDLAAYRVVERKPLIGEYHGARIVSASPPSSGGVALLDELNILSGFDMRSAAVIVANIDSATIEQLAPSMPARPGTAFGRFPFFQGFRSDDVPGGALRAAEDSSARRLAVPYRCPLTASRF